MQGWGSVWESGQGHKGRDQSRGACNNVRDESDFTE